MTRSFVWCAAAFAVQHGNTALHIAVDVDTSLSQLLVAEVMRANPAQVVAQNNVSSRRTRCHISTTGDWFAAAPTTCVHCR